MPFFADEGTMSMKTVCIVMRSAFELTWKLGLIMIAIALPASMLRGVSDAPVGRSGGASSGAAPAADDTIQVTMTSAGEHGRSSCALLDEDGSELLRVNYDRRGYMHLAWGERFSACPSLMTTMDGGLGLHFKTNGLLYKLLRRSEGSTRFELVGLSDGIRRFYRITKTGDVIRVPTESDD